MFTRTILAMAAALFALPAAAGDLTITIAGICSNVGTLLIGVYDSREGFDSAVERSAELSPLIDRRRVAGLALRAVAGSRTVVIGRARPGRYAIISHHDQNQNGKLDVSFWGVPREGYGFSNDARGFFGPPSFDSASFVVGDDDTSLVIHLIYPADQEQP